MKTFLRINFLLLPIMICGFGSRWGVPITSGLLALAWCVGQTVILRGRKWPPAFELGLILGITVFTAAAFLGVTLPPLPIILAGLSGGAVISVIQGRPWTSEHAASEHGSVKDSKLFHDINKTLSLVWAVLFGWGGFTAWLELPGWVSWGPMAMGTALSVGLPPLMIRRYWRRSVGPGSWKPPKFDERDAPISVDVAIIGAGIGGLTAAALLADHGLKVAVYDQHVLPGGFAHNWLRVAPDRDSATGKKRIFRFDSGVHDVSGWWPGGPVHSLFTKLGLDEALEWQRVTHRLVNGTSTIDVKPNWRAFVDDICRFFPNDSAGLRALFDDVHRIFLSMYSTASERSGFPGRPGSVEVLLAFAKDNPLAVAWMDRPWRELLDRHIEGQDAKAWIEVLANYVTDDASQLTVAEFVPIFGYFFRGGHYPIGGSGGIAQALTNAIEARGGAVFLKTPVQEVCMEAGKACGVLLEDGQIVPAAAVISNADLGSLVTNLITDPDHQRAMKLAFGQPRPSCSAVGIHLGIQGTTEGPASISIVTEEGDAIGIFQTSAIDPSAAPDGTSVIEILQIISPKAAQAWFPKTDIDIEIYRYDAVYLARKREMGDRLIAAAQSVIPNLESRILYRSEFTPVTTQRYTWTQNGAIYGPLEKAKTKTPIPNLVLAGSATMGSGIEAAVISGANAAEALVPGLLAPQKP